MFRVTNFEAKTLSWWHSSRSKIDMSPSYQRKGRLWSSSDRALLVDTILNEFDIPKIYVADFTFSTSMLNRKKMSYAIIDGKQRLETIFGFFSSEFALAEEFVLLDQPKLKLGGLTYADLKKNYPEIADRFDNFNLTVMRVVTDDEAMIQDLFVRLNRSKPLTGAEIRNAIPGPVPKIIQELSDHEFFASIVKFKTDRAQDKNAAAKLLIFEYNARPVATKKRNLDEFAKTAGKKDKVKLSNSAKQALICLEQMTNIFVPKDVLLMSAGMVPVYYWLIRGVPEKKHFKIREFLVSVQRQIKDPTVKSPLGPAQLDEYRQLARSINDEKSLNGLVELLHNSFLEFS